MTPKWIALSALLVVVVIGCVALGAWQWSRIQQGRVIEQPTATEPVALASIYRPGQPVPADEVGVPVQVTGRYDASKQLLVPGRLQGGVSGYWVVTPLVVDGGGLVPVVRGWSAADSGDQVEPVAGRVEILGRLQTSEGESLRTVGGASLPDGQVEIVSSAELISLWEGELYQGFVGLVEQQPASDLDPVDLTTPQVQPISWQSLAYTVQWWLFAAFAIFFWSRMLQADRADIRDHRVRQDDVDPSVTAELSEVHE